MTPQEVEHARKCSYCGKYNEIPHAHTNGLFCCGNCCTIMGLLAAESPIGYAWAVEILERLEAADIQDQLAAYKSLRCELATIFGAVKAHHSMTWEACMLSRIGESLAKEAEKVKRLEKWATVALGAIPDALLGLRVELRSTLDALKEGK